MNTGLYVHIPFCRKKCFYCDFPSMANGDDIYSDYTAALCKEIVCQGGVFSGENIDTIYIGGGTPSVLPLEYLYSIYESAHKSFKIDKNAEISIEVNPGTTDFRKLSLLRQWGINRLSIGVQSFSDSLLKALGRIHSGRDAVECIEAARKAGFDAINADLMYGLPGQTLDHLKVSIEQAVALDIAHISVYGLKIEEGTVFANLADSGKLDLPDEETEEKMYDFVIDLLYTYGYQRYEISNFARHNAYCRHNMKYWNFEPYIGVGAAAHSFINGQRLANTSDVTRYIKLINDTGSAIDFCDNADTRERMAEFIFLALRTTMGMDAVKFEKVFFCNFFTLYNDIVTKLVERGLLTVTGDKVKLTEQGMKFGNVVFRAFLAD